MRSFSLSELQQPLAGSLRGDDVSFDAVSTDTRSIVAGDLFVALQGPSFDGHEFLAVAAERGACAAMVSRHDQGPLAAIQVADTQVALGQLAALNRSLFTGKLVGITGSNGKTTVKNMLAAILRQVGPTLATAGNLNNEIGLPLTLLQLQAGHEYAVIEMGAARAGDIQYLCGLAKPAVSVLLNALPAHLEGFGDVAGVARAKGEIFSGLAAGGIAVINADSQFAPLWREQAGAASRIEFGFSEASAVTARGIIDRGLQGSSFQLLTAQGEVTVNLALPGRHNILNAVAAAAAAIALGIELAVIAGGLSRAQAEAGRLNAALAPGGALVIDDAYNANPGSVRAAIDLLASCEGRRILVLGTMAELGRDSMQLHRQIGEYAARSGIEELWLTGAETTATAAGFGPGAVHCVDRDDLVFRLQGRFSEGEVVLVKGSRSVGMEAVVTALLGRKSGEA